MQRWKLSLRLVLSATVFAVLGAGACGSPNRRFDGGSGGSSVGGETATGGRETSGAGVAGRTFPAGAGQAGEQLGAGDGGESPMAGSGGAAFGGSAGSGGTAGVGGVPLKLPAAICAADGECESKHCVDGVCCDTACTGGCYECNSVSSPGHCSAVASGKPAPAGRPACAMQTAASCGTDGACDGKGACHQYESGTDCAAGSCDAASNSAVTAKSCDGGGHCLAASPVSCAPFKCAGAACATKCIQDADCVGQPCVNTSCGTVGNGSVCKSDAQCTSGHCADGLCCNSSCTGSCQACDLTGKEGVCSTLPPAAKPHAGHAACTTGACTSSCDGTSANCTFQSGAACGTCHACSANGVCQEAGDGTADPACPSSAANCVVGGCNAFGACKAAPAGTACGGYSCAASITGIGQYTAVDHHKKACDGGAGAASCKAALNEGCPGNLLCGDTANCKTSCSQDVDCLSGYFCKAGVCTAWIPTDSATTCTSNAQCASRICSVGKCVECGENADCPPSKWSCGSGGHCGCPQGAASCGTCDATQFLQLCPSARGSSCDNGICDCWKSGACPAGTICVATSGAGPGYCLLPVGMPCHANGDCAGNNPMCSNGVCAKNSNNCAHKADCSDVSQGFCCNAYGNMFPYCSSDCG